MWYSNKRESRGRIPNLDEDDEEEAGEKWVNCLLVAEIKVEQNKERNSVLSLLWLKEIG